MHALAEAARAVIGTFQSGKIIYINFLTEIQPECDCMPSADVPVMQDQGILVSDDIVSIEQATIDMLSNKKPLPQSAMDEYQSEPGDILFCLSRKPYKLQIDAAERLGLGSKQYKLVEIQEF